IASAAVSLLQDRDPAVRTEARTTVRALGNQGIDQLVIRLQQALEQDRPELLDALTYAMDKTHMEYRARNAAPVAGLLLGHQDQQVRVHAASVLRQIGIHAVEPLIVQISQSSGKEEAQLREALQSLGPPPTAILRDVMTKTDLPLAARYEALSITKSLWENGDKSVADSSVALVALLKDEDAGLRSTAAQLLGEFGTLASHSIPDLIECLKDPQETVRGSVLQALQRMGRDALPWLIETVEHGDSAVKLSAVQAIAGSNLEHMHGLEKPQFQKALREVLEDPDTEVRFYAAVALARMHIPDTQAINVLANALSSSTFMMRLQAVQALGKIAPAAVSAMDRLTSLATADENQAVKTEAATVLARMRLFAPLPSEAAAGPPRECQTMSPQDLAHSLREAHATALAAYRARADAEEALRVFAASCMPPASSATPGPLPKGEYAALLNDFAFFELEQYKALPIEKQALSRAIVDDAIARLRTVLELLPRRAVAHLNLTEALLLHSQFLEFDHLIQHSKSYKRFSKQPLDATGEWLLSLSSTIDACRFTVALKDKGRLMDASALANQGLIDIDNDGLTDRISFRRTESGTPSSLAITFGNPDKTDESDESPEGSGLYHPDTYPGGKLMVMGFKQKYYLVHYRDSSHGLLLSHLEELNDAGSKTLCEFANTATESLPSALDKERVRLGSALLKKTIKYGVEQNSYVILGKEAIGPLQSLLTSQPIQGTGILLWKGSIDIDNDGRAETMGLIRVYTSPGAYLDLFVKGNEDLTNFPDDWMNHFLLMQAQAGFTLRPFTWKGATYLEKRSDMHTTFVHEIITLDKGTANAVLSFDITLQSQFSRYGDAPDTATRGPDRNSVKVIANIPR
ncbi:MAG: HEAT repeat domain-containing protein, partial [Nitrospira sp.]|nr:HEAT repeat domain-containing protein [Nitrospira sp.]